MTLILVLGLAVPVFAAETQAATPTLTLAADKETLAPGDTVTVTLVLDQALSGLNNYQFNVHYDAARFELTGSTVGAAPTVVSQPRKDERSGTDCITVSGLSTEGQAVALAAGTVATLTFTAKEAAALGEAEFAAVTQALPAYADLAQVQLTVVNDAKVTLTEAASVLLGDFNGDGEIKLTDFLMAFYASRTGRQLTTHEAAAADLNGDGTISVAEALRVFYLVKSKQ